MQNNLRSTLMVNTTSEDSCPHYVTYECTTVTSSPKGATYWNGSIFQDCSHIIFPHTPADDSGHVIQYCNKRSIEGMIMEVVANTSYTSQLTIKLNFDIIGRGINCFLDVGNGTRISIGRSNIAGIATIIIFDNYNSCMRNIMHFIFS